MLELSPKMVDAFTTETLKLSVQLIINTWLKPSLEKFQKNRKLRRDIEENVFYGNFQEYLENASENCRFINTIVFNDERKEIDQLYIPLTLENNSINQSILIESYDSDFIDKYKKILIKDSAGMGKSTLMRWLFLGAIKKNAGIPIFIELRKLNTNNKILDEIYNNINSINCDFDKEFILELIKRGDFIFFLDGYDEISFESSISVTRDIQNFINKASKNIFILSSRPSDSLTSFGRFQSFTIKPLSNDEAFLLLGKYDKNNKYAEKLIKKIEEGDNLEQLSEFLGNPMMVSLLYKGFEYKPTVPYKKHLFYRNVYDALFEHHDLSKGDSFSRVKKTQLDSDEFHRVLRKLAFYSLKENEIEFNKDRIIQLIENAKKNTTDKKFNSSDFLLDCHTSVPLFVELGNNYKWMHKSIMEYFAAKYIEIDSRQDQVTIMKTIYNSDRDYQNLLDLYYDIDYPSFERNILYELSKEFHEYYYKEISKYECYPSSNHFDVKKRVEICFNIENLTFISSDKVLSKLEDLQEDSIDFLVQSDEFCFVQKSKKKSTKSILRILENRKSELLIPFEQISKKIPNLVFLAGINLDLELDHNPNNVLNSQDNFNLISDILWEDYPRMFSDKIVKIKRKYETEQNDDFENLLKGL